MKFKVSTALKDLIGRELITNDFTAIYELIKNGYDADARKVIIEFKSVKKRRGEAEILIIDDGYGMSADDVNTKWLVVGFSEKRPESRKGVDFRDEAHMRKRRFAGAKGIGRFSADRLGRRLTLYTRQTGEHKVNRLEIDWERFEKDQNDQFQSVDVIHSSLDGFPADVDPRLASLKNGTVLQISFLRSGWDRAKLLKLRRYLQRLVNPSEDPDSEDFKIEISAKEFAGDDGGKEEHDIVNGLIRNVVFERLNIKTTQISCFVENGRMTTRLVDKGKWVFELTEENEYNELDQMRIFVSYLNPEAKAAFTRIMGLQPVKYGSIFLYKNRFRIHPYGDPDDDWLGLERRKGQGYARFLSAREIIGRVEVYGGQPGFREVSSRDAGVIQSEAYGQLLKAFTEKVLRRLERYVIDAIDWDKGDEERRRTPEQIQIGSIRTMERILGGVKDPKAELKFNEGLVEILEERQIENLPEMIENLGRLAKQVKSPQEREFIGRQIRGLQLAFRNLEREKEEELAIRDRQALFLAGEVSADVQKMDNLTHAIRIVTDVIGGMLEEIAETVRTGGGLDSVLQIVDSIRLENRKARLLSEIALRAAFDATKDVLDEDIVFYIKQYVETILGGRKLSRVTFRLWGENHVFRRKFSITDISLLLDNFVSNSKKAGANLITIGFEIHGDSLRIYIGDNGQGIEKRNEKQLFTRGFSTTGGSGIGLHHVKTIIHSMGGEVRFAGNNFKEMGRGACFEVILP